MKNNIFKLTLFCFCFSILSAVMAAPTPYVLAAGDALEIKVLNKSEMDTKQTIAPDGSVSLPTIGRLAVSGMTLDALQKKVDAKYSEYVKNADVVVYVTPRPIFVVQHDPRKLTWEVKKADSPAEALAYMGKSTNDSSVPSLSPGDVVTVNYEIGRAHV